MQYVLRLFENDVEVSTSSVAITPDAQSYSSVGQTIDDTWRVTDVISQARTEQLRKEQSPPRFYNYDGSVDPINVSGKEHSAQGPFMNLHCLITVVNTTQAPIKVNPVRLVVDGQERTLENAFFRLKDGSRERLKKISLRGNDKEDYELHFMFPDDQCPTSKDGELWVSSDNRPEPITLKVKFR